jgi:hypothetical protein
MLELKTAVATHRYVPRSFLHLTCALSMHGFTLLAFDNPSEVKPECDFATCRLAAQDPPSFVFCFMPQQTTSSLSSSKQRTPSAHTHITPTRDQSSSRSYARRYSRPADHRHRPWSPLARFTSRIGSLILTCSTLVSCSSLTLHRQKTLLSGLSKTWSSILTALFTSPKTASLVPTPVSDVTRVPITLLRR